MTQRQLLPAWLLPAIAILVALALAAFILYETLLKPAIKSTADDAAAKAVKSQASSAAAQVSSAKKEAAAANQAASKAQAAASSAAKNGGGAGAGGSASASPKASATGGTVNGVPLSDGQAISFSIQTDVTPSPGNFTKFTVSPGPTIPANKMLVITAVVMQNPNGNEGTLQIQRGTGGFLLQEGLANFRDLDYHFDDEPIVFRSDQPLQVAVNCQKAGAGGAAHCNPSILFTGRYVARPKASSTP